MIWQLGWRNIWRNKRRTGVILTAVVVGVWAMIFLGGLMRGIADQLVRNGINTLTGHLQIQAPGFRSDPALEHRMRDPEPLFRALAHLPPGSRWTPRLRVSGIAANARNSAGVTLVGIEPEQEARVSFIGSAVAAGRYLEPAEPYGILVGQALADDLETGLGRKLVLMAQDATGEVASRAFRVVGIYRAELEATEQQFTFVSLAAAREMLQVGQGLSEIAVLLPDRQEVAAAAADLRSGLPADRFRVQTWQELLPLVTTVLRMYDGFILFWFVAVFVAMGFGLVNTILMAVFERVREFGLLRALGMKTRLVVAVVLAESFYLLLLGVLAGNLLGLLSVAALAESGIDLSAFAAGAEYAGMARVIYPSIYPRDVALANGTVLVLGLLVSIYPALKAARFSPVEAMRRQ